MFKIGIWELRRMRRGFEKGKHSLCREEEDVNTFTIKMPGNEGKNL
jgi:hypothetical protein